MLYKIKIKGAIIGILSILVLILCIATCSCIKRLSNRNRLRNRNVGHNTSLNNNSNDSHLNISEFPYVYRNYDEQSSDLNLDQSDQVHYKKNQFIDENLPTYEQAVNNYKN